MQLQRVCHDTLDFIQVPGYPSAIRVFTLTHSRRNVVQRLPWLISVSLGSSLTSKGGGAVRWKAVRSLLA